MPAQAGLQAALVQVRLASSLTNRGEYDASEQNFLAAIPVLEARLGMLGEILHANDVGTGLREEFYRRRADAARAAGDQCCLACQ